MDKLEIVTRFASANGSAQVETWDTRFGKSKRVVKRNSDGSGRFVDNVSAKQLSK